MSRGCTELSEWKIDARMVCSKPVGAMSALKKSSSPCPLRVLPLLFAGFLSCLPAIVAQSPASLASVPKPADIPQLWKQWIGEYGSLISHSATTFGPVYALSEQNGAIWILQREDKAEEITYKPVEKFALNQPPPTDPAHRSEERRVGKACMPRRILCRLPT